MKQEFNLKKIFLPSSIAREIQQQQQIHPTPSLDCSYADKSFDGYCHQLITSKGHVTNQYEGDKRMMDFSRGLPMSAPIPIPFSSDDSNEEEEEYFEQQQLRNRYNNATWKLYTLIRESNQSSLWKQTTSRGEVIPELCLDQECIESDEIASTSIVLDKERGGEHNGKLHIETNYGFNADEGESLHFHFEW